MKLYALHTVKPFSKRLNHNGIRAVNETKTRTPIHFPEAESIFPTIFGHLIVGIQNAVRRLALEGEIPQNYENRSERL